LGENFCHHTHFGKNQNLIRPSASQIEFSHATARASLSHLVLETWPKTFVTRSVFKKMARVPKPAKTNEIFLAPGHDLTFPSHVQNLVAKICCHTHFEKNERRRHSSSAHVHFFSHWQGPHFSMLNPKLGRDILSPPPFLKKRKPDPPLGLTN